MLDYETQRRIELFLFEEALWVGFLRFFKWLGRFGLMRWFDARLAARSLSRAQLAVMLGLSAEQIAELWKDQRELSVRDVRLLSELLGEPAQEIASRAGVSTPVPPPQPTDVFVALAETNARLARMERSLVELKALVLDLARSRDG